MMVNNERGSTANIQQGDKAARTDFVQSLERGISVIRTFNAENPSLSLSQVAARTGLNRAATRRFLHTLAELGYVRVDGRQFSLSPRVLELGYSYISSLRFPDVAQPHLQALSNTVKESCSIAVLDFPNVFYVARVNHTRIVNIHISVGTRNPAFANSMGRVLLAGKSDEWLDEHLDSRHLRSVTSHTITDLAQLRTALGRVREDGYAVIDRELDDAVLGIAVPIHDAEGEVIAAMNVVTHAVQHDLDSVVSRLVPPLKRAAQDIEADFNQPVFAMSHSTRSNQLMT